jgi:hypothetical protein
LWKEFRIDEGLETMNTGFLRGRVDELTKAYPAIPTTIEGRGQGQELVAVPEVR